MDQRQLVERAARGDHDAFATLFLGAVARLDAAARLILRDPELARDAVQDASIRAWRDLPGLRDPDRFDAWLHRLTVRSCLDLLRRRKRRPMEVELSPADSIPIPDIASVVANHDELDRALRRLDPDVRVVVVVHYFLGLSLQETADTMGIPVGTAKSRLNRSLLLMRETLDVAQPARSGGLPEGRFA